MNISSLWNLYQIWSLKEKLSGWLVGCLSRKLSEKRSLQYSRITMGCVVFFLLTTDIYTCILKMWKILTLILIISWKSCLVNWRIHWSRKMGRGDSTRSCMALWPKKKERRWWRGKQANKKNGSRKIHSSLVFISCYELVLVFCRDVRYVTSTLIK